MVINKRNVINGIRNILPSNMILAQDVEIGKLYFMDKIQSRNFVHGFLSKQHANVTVIAHNARAYDAYFIYNYLLMQSITPEIIFRGSNIMYCKVGRV